jgi:hypothetical protein
VNSANVDIKQVALKMLILESQLEKACNEESPMLADRWSETMESLLAALCPTSDTRGALRFSFDASLVLRVPETGAVIRLDAIDLSWTGFRARGDLSALAGAREVELVEVRHHLRVYRVNVPCEIRWFRPNGPSDGAVGFSMRPPFDETFRLLYQRAYTRFLNKLAADGIERHGAVA